MLERTKKHRTNWSNDLAKYDKEGSSIPAEVYMRKIEEHFNLPRWAILLAGARYRDGITQKELAALIGVKQSNVSAMERGKRPIGKDIAKRLAEVFKTDYRDFL